MLIKILAAGEEDKKAYFLRVLQRKEGMPKDSMIDAVDASLFLGRCPIEKGGVRMTPETFIADLLCEYGKWCADNAPTLTHFEKGLCKGMLEEAKNQVHRRYDHW